jgi:hypothetical protein
LREAKRLSAATAICRNFIGFSLAVLKPAYTVYLAMTLKNLAGMALRNLNPSA